MEALLLDDYIETEQQEDFVIDSDNKAEWALKTIAKNNRDRERIMNVCDAQVDFYNSKSRAATRKCEQDNESLLRMLEAYFNTVETKSTKTQATYILPSGKLVRKFESVGYVYNEAEVIDAYKDTDYVENVPKLKWGELKKTLSIAGESVVDGNGEIVECIKTEVKPGKFSVSI